MEKEASNGNRENYLNYILDQFSDLENITFRKMIGGIGFFYEDLMFGAIIGGKLRFQAPASCADKQGTASFILDEWARQSREVPESVIENKILLKGWAEKAILLMQRAQERAVEGEGMPGS